MIAALFVETGGCYYGLPHVDPWDVERDARFYPGPWQVIAHPPCETWGQMRNVNNARYGNLPVGDDGKCFERALLHVETYGGILEHPRESMAFAKFGIDKPSLGFWKKTRAGYVTQVCQSNYGHRAQKSTWLYVCGIDRKYLPILDWRDTKGTHRISGFDNTKNLPYLPKDERASTPIPFRDLLISISERCHRH